ncbi:MAG: hypothetical protein KAT58_12500, partial [candidate division Zixibacteria bacterium]|nr:hypothetical protein [candidate division Zixibacteria bacterium]
MMKIVAVNIAVESGVCRVTSGDIIVNPEDTISFTNGTDGHLHIQFADHRVHHETITVPPGKTVEEV